MLFDGGVIKLGNKGKKLIQNFEQFRATLYDTDGAGHCTVGWGHLVHRGLCDGRKMKSNLLGSISIQGRRAFLSGRSTRREICK